MDIATIVGLLAGVGLIGWAILSKSPLSAFIDGPSFAIVIGGSIAAALFSAPLKNVMALGKVMKNAFFAKAGDPGSLIKELVGFAEVARRDGILALESATKEAKDPFVIKGIQMAVDGADPELIEQILNSDLDAMAERHSTGKQLFEIVGRYAPAFGMIGTLIGLVIMLGNMEDASNIGPAMAVALLTTLYGAFFANLIALPIADKLGTRSSEELLLKTIIIKGVMSIQSGDNPRIVEQKLLTYLPPRMRAGAGKADAEE